MEVYIVEPTKSSPRMEIDFVKGLVDIRGESYPENAVKFYEPFLAKLDELLANMSSKSLQVNIELQYFNSSSSKILLDFFERLEDATQEGASIQVFWIYHPENETILECGEEFQEDAMSLHFRLIPKE